MSLFLQSLSWHPVRMLATMGSALMLLLRLLVFFLVARFVSIRTARGGPLDVPGQGSWLLWSNSVLAYEKPMYKCGQPRSASSCSPRGSTYLDPQGMVGGLLQGFPGSSPLNPGMVHGPLGRGPPPKRSQTPPTSRRGPTVSPKHHPGVGTGYVRFDEGPLVPPPAPVSSQPVNQVLSPGLPSGCGAPLPVGPVVDSVADQLRALELLSSLMDPPEIEALRSRLVPPPYACPF